MKRELKRILMWRIPPPLRIYCKAYPDEKGIETSVSLHLILCLISYCKAYPDEKGIETILEMRLAHLVGNCKAYPDEKGIETRSPWGPMRSTSKIAKPIPMKRELKRIWAACWSMTSSLDCKAYPDEKGIETAYLLWQGIMGGMPELQSLSR